MGCRGGVCHPRLGGPGRHPRREGASAVGQRREPYPPGGVHQHPLRCSNSIGPSSCEEGQGQTQTEEETPEEAPLRAKWSATFHPGEERKGGLNYCLGSNLVNSPTPQAFLTSMVSPLRVIVPCHLIKARPQVYRPFGSHQVPLCAFHT